MTSLKPSFYNDNISRTQIQLYLLLKFFFWFYNFCFTKQIRIRFGMANFISLKYISDDCCC